MAPTSSAEGRRKNPVSWDNDKGALVFEIENNKKQKTSAHTSVLSCRDIWQKMPQNNQVPRKAIIDADLQ